MNRRARNQGFFVLYPEQDREANPSGCWNWFMPEHQQRGRGEPALLASMTLAVVQQYGIDPQHVFIAGMSAGGAMACIMAQAYPELFAAVGVHSGLPIGAASNMDEALTVMNQGDSTPGPAADEPLPQHTPCKAHQHTPVIVFHGDQDLTVHPKNGEQVVKEALGDTPTQMQVKQGTSSSGRRYTRQIYTGQQNRVMAEYWLVHDTGHAWSGGSLRGSYTDRHGPDASAEMLRFFFKTVA
jgi:poly(hydroxyalkanoate) depolymerase family esterase